MKPLKILFASIPFDGHFNPLTDLAVHLKKCGHDVRWYTQNVYKDKLEKLGIPHYPFRKAVQLNQFNLDTVFSDRLKIKGQIKRLNFDLQHVFVLRAPEFYEDITNINRNFSFDILIADVMFTAIPLVRHLLKKPVIAVGVLPLVETSKDLAPAGLGMTPDYSFLGRIKQSLLRNVTDRYLLGPSHELYRKVMAAYGIKVSGNTMDFLVKSASLFLQSGTPGFEYRRSDLGENIRFIGSLLPVKSKKSTLTDDVRIKALTFRKVILVTQGTIEKDPSKIIIPTLEAYRNTPYLVIATTGGSRTAELRAKYQHNNIVIEDFIPFEEILPFTDVYISNGGYGGVMLSIAHSVPLVVAGVHEGKNEINARVGFFGLGINLKTETPNAKQIRRSVRKILSDDKYKLNTFRLCQEFGRYDPKDLTEKYIYQAVRNTRELGEPVMQLT